MCSDKKVMDYREGRCEGDLGTRSCRAPLDFRLAFAIETFILTEDEMLSG